MKYIICKASRGYTGRGYAGVACRIAEIDPGMIYTDKAQAIEDAKKLGEANPVGFHVYDFYTKERVDNT